RKNINSIIGLIKDNFIDSADSSHIYNSHNTVDIEDILRRSEIELANYELKQGLLMLGGSELLIMAFMRKYSPQFALLLTSGKVTKTVWLVSY
ncbi:TPA: hypothetical protein ACIPDQ_003855, partial [Salmonella enterica subsp. enterica serovar Bareilly]